MEKKIKWSSRAWHEKENILLFWIEHNLSDTYSIKLDRKFIEGVESLLISPEMGLPTSWPDVRIKIIERYMVYYRIQPAALYILAIWDTRRDPSKFKL